MKLPTNAELNTAVEMIDDAIRSLPDANTRHMLGYLNSIRVHLAGLASRLPNEPQAESWFEVVDRKLAKALRRFTT